MSKYHPLYIIVVRICKLIVCINVKKDIYIYNKNYIKKNYQQNK